MYPEDMLVFNLMVYEDINLSEGVIICIKFSFMYFLLFCYWAYFRYDLKKLCRFLYDFHIFINFFTHFYFANA